MAKPFGYTSSDFPCNDTCCFNEMEIRLRDRFRLLWLQHIYWTRIVILGIAFDSPDLEASTNRLLRNAPDFAKVFCRFYGDRVANKIERLITDHLAIAAELVKAAKAGNSRAAEDAEQRWYKNANEISRFMAHINPYWSYESMRAMWFEHLSLTKDEAVAILNQEYPRSIELFGQIEKLALRMADDMSNGIICQFGL